MGKNILITGAAGYIGGSILASIIARKDGLIESSNISAVVRSAEQVKALVKLGVNVIKLDFTDEASVIQAVVDNKIDLVIHTASSMDTRQASALISGLGQRRKIGGEEIYFIHTSLTTMFAAEGGWPYGEIKDTDPVYEKEKQIEKGNPVRDTNIFIVEHAKVLGVTSFIVPVPFVYGVGTGECRKQSVYLPSHIQAFIKLKAVYIWDKEGNPPAAHISDVVSLYALLAEKILKQETIPSGEKGYYFVVGHKSPWWNVMKHLSDVMFARGLVKQAATPTWPSDEMAADALGLPLAYIRAMETSSGEMIAVNGPQLGWHLEWDQDRYLGSMDEEVRAVLEMTTIKATIFDNLLKLDK
ncbi:hypothetical protein IFR05_007604 [Cadophora sp. M221]|nr:hypothetical protein IFR05_007604 [Cadophora sp. M221]